MGGWDWSWGHTVPALVPPTRAATSRPPPAPQVSALRSLSQQGLCNCDFVVASTSLCTGASLLSTLVAEGGGAAALAPDG